MQNNSLDLKGLLSANSIKLSKIAKKMWVLLICLKLLDMVWRSLATPTDCI